MATCRYEEPKGGHTSGTRGRSHPHPIIDPAPSITRGPIFAPSANRAMKRTFFARRVATVAKLGCKGAGAVGIQSQPPTPASIDPFFGEASLLFEEEDLKAGHVNNLYAAQRAYIGSNNILKNEDFGDAKEKMHEWSLTENFSEGKGR